MMDQKNRLKVHVLFVNTVLILGFFTWSLSVVNAQTKYRTKSGTVHFNASTPIEDIEASNEEVNAILEVETGRFAIVMLIKDFEFPRKLMQEHFNENYLESDKYPKAYFTGTIANFSWETLTEEAEQKTIEGNLTIHGITLERREKVKLRKIGDAIQLEADFLVRPEAHKIEVPEIVFTKIAEEVQVVVDLQLNTPQ